MTKVSKRVLAGVALAVILAVSITGGIMAAGPANEDCPNDRACLYGGEGPGDGTGLQWREQANTAASNQHQFNNQFNANGNCNANQHSRSYRHGYGLTDD